MSDDDDDDTPPETNFFTRRAFLPQITPEEFQSVAESLNVNNPSKGNSEEILCPPVKRVKTKGASLKKISSVSKKIVSIPEVVLDDNEDPPDTPKVVLSAAARRRLKKLQADQASELKDIKAANKQVLTAAESISDSDGEDMLLDNHEEDVNIILTISYMSELMMLRCHQNEKFFTIFPRVAALFKLKASEILLCLRDQNIKVDDTPKSLNMTLADTIECIPYKADEKAQENDVDKLKLIFQSNDSKGKIELFVHKLEKMQDVMERYSAQRDIPLDRLQFEFDGERINGSETPEDLDIESDNCVDVKVSSAASPTKKRGRLTKVQEQKKEVPVVDVTDESVTPEDLVIHSGNCPDIQVQTVGPAKKRGRHRRTKRKKKQSIAPVIGVTDQSAASPAKTAIGLRRSQRIKKQAIAPVIDVTDQSDPEPSTSANYCIV